MLYRVLMCAILDPHASLMQWGMPRIVACSRVLLTIFTFCSHTSELCCTTGVHTCTVNCYRGCGNVFHIIHITYRHM